MSEETAVRRFAQLRPAPARYKATPDYWVKTGSAIPMDPQDNVPVDMTIHHKQATPEPLETCNL